MLISVSPYPPTLPPHPLHSGFGRKEVVECLIEKGATVDIQDDGEWASREGYGLSLLSLSLSLSHTHLVLGGCGWGGGGGGGGGVGEEAWLAC